MFPDDAERVTGLDFLAEENMLVAGTFSSMLLVFQVPSGIYKGQGEGISPCDFPVLGTSGAISQLE